MRLIFAEDFIIIYSNQVADEVSIVAEKKEKQYVSDWAQKNTDRVVITDLVMTTHFFIHGSPA